MDKKVLVVIAIIAVIAIGAAAYVALSQSQDNKSDALSIDYGTGFEMKSTVTDPESKVSYSMVFKTTTYTKERLELTISMGGKYQSNASIYEINKSKYVAEINGSEWYSAEYIDSEGKWHVHSSAEESYGSYDYVLSCDQNDNILFRLTEVVINTFNRSTSGDAPIGITTLFVGKISNFDRTILIIRGTDARNDMRVILGDDNIRYKYVINSGGSVMRTNEYPSISTTAMSCNLYSVDDIKIGDKSFKGVTKSYYIDGELHSISKYDYDLRLVLSYSDVDGSSTTNTLNVDYIKSA